jgi:hypothetical protein
MVASYEGEEVMFEKLFPRNESGMDRMLRVVLGVALISMVFVGPHTALGWIGLVPLVTGIVGSCPLYRLVGFSTCDVTPRAPRRPA